MTDYKAEAERIVPHHACCPDMREAVATALEAYGEKRGRAEGLREAARKVALLGTEVTDALACELEARAKEVERS